MSCNCKTTEKILSIHKRYGRDIKLPLKEHLTYHFKESIKFLLLSLIIIMLFPLLLFISIILLITGNNTINLNKILKRLLNKNE